jgi:hypothetical protein
MLRYRASVGKESLACTLPSDTRWEEYDRNGEIIGLDEQTEQTLFKSRREKKRLSFKFIFIRKPTLACNQINQAYTSTLHAGGKGN